MGGFASNGAALRRPGRGTSPTACAARVPRGSLAKGAGVSTAGGREGINQSANAEAVAAFEQALSAIAHLPQTRETIEQGIDLRLALRNCLVPLAGYERALDYLRDAHALAQQIDDPGRRGWIALYMTILLRHRGQLKDALEWGQLALDAATTLDDAPLRMMTKFFTGQAHVILGIIGTQSS